MFKQLQHMFASQKWLRTVDPMEKRAALSFRIAEVLHDAITGGMDINGASLVVSKDSIGVQKTTRGLNSAIARIYLNKVSSLQTAFRLVYVGRGNLTESQVNDAVERAFNDLAQEVLRQVYGSEYIKKHYSGNQKSAVSRFEAIMLGFHWIHTANVLNKFFAFFFFVYLVATHSFFRGLTYGITVIVGFGVISSVGNRVNNSRAGDPLEEDALATGSMPPFMLKVLLVTTLSLVVLNGALIWFFLR